MQDYSDIEVSTTDAVTTITINRPRVLNALRTHTYEELALAVRTAADDDEIGVVVITGAGHKAFCSGGDIKAQRSRTRTEAVHHARSLLRLAHELRASGKPTIAAVNGYAIGAGHELHLMCDLTIASDNAIFGQTGPKVGSVPVWGATQMLPAIVGDKRAREIVYLCRQYNAQEAEAMGLVNLVVPQANLMSEVRRICDELLDKSPQSLRLAKLSINATTDVLWTTFLHGLEALSLMNGSEESREGARAFLEKRAPNYRQFRRASVALTDV
jgi:dihydroxynaphthoic acid synthetase